MDDLCSQTIPWTPLASALLTHRKAHRMASHAFACHDIPSHATTRKGITKPCADNATRHGSSVSTSQRSWNPYSDAPARDPKTHLRTVLGNALLNKPNSCTDNTWHPATRTIASQAFSDSDGISVTTDATAFIASYHQSYMQGGGHSINVTTDATAFSALRLAQAIHSVDTLTVWTSS